MQRKYTAINTKLRNKILEESRVPGCVLADLAKRYGIRRELLYKWRRRYVLKPSSEVVKAKNFVEARIEDNVDVKSSISKNKKLKKACLEFEDFKLSIEGSFSSNCIKQIMEIVC